MGKYVFKLPDVGEGTAEAEIVAWHVKVGDTIHEDQNMVDVMTDKATVEMTSPVSGKVIALHGEPGAMAAVGSALVELEVEGAGNVKAGAAAPAPKAEAPKPAAPKAEAKPEPKKEDVKPAATAPAMHAAAKPAFATRSEGDKPLASPAVRQRAREMGIELQFVPGTGPAGRIGHEDLDAYIQSGGKGLGARAPHAAYVQRDGVDEVKVIGLRRKIAESMQNAKRRIPHFAYVEEIDMTELESLRAHLNKTKRADQPKLNVLPFIMRALVKVLPDYPQARLARIWEHHGVVEVPDGARRPELGERVTVVPNHVCATVNLVDELVVDEGEGVVWPVSARGRNS